MDYPDFPPKHPLSDAIHHVVLAILTASQHIRGREGKFTEQDVHLFGRLRETMWIHYFHAAHVFDDAAYRLRQAARGAAGETRPEAVRPGDGF